MIQVVPISAEAFAPYGDVVPPQAGESRPNLVAAWTEIARDRYRADLKPLELSLPARPPELGFIEAHPNSPSSR